MELQQANARLREADEMKNRFLSMVSHELRTPLTTTRGFTQTLRAQGDHLTDEERDRFLEIIDKQGGHPLRMVEELLMTSRIVSGRTPYGAPPLAIEVVEGEAIHTLRVRDHGPGVDPGFRDLLFDPFRQGDEARRATASSGVGLGLAIVVGLVHANGGTIEYVPADPGSTFEVRLPAAHEVIEAPSNRAVSAPG